MSRLSFSNKLYLNFNSLFWLKKSNLKGSSLKWPELILHLLWYISGPCNPLVYESEIENRHRTTWNKLCRNWLYSRIVDVNGNLCRLIRNTNGGPNPWFRQYKSSASRNQCNWKCVLSLIFRSSFCCDFKQKRQHIHRFRICQSICVVYKTKWNIYAW